MHVSVLCWCQERFRVIPKLLKGSPLTGGASGAKTVPRRVIALTCVLALLRGHDLTKACFCHLLRAGTASCLSNAGFYHRAQILSLRVPSSPGPMLAHNHVTRITRRVRGLLTFPVRV